MIAAMLLVIAVVLFLPVASGSFVVSPVTTTPNLVCDSKVRRFDITADYRDWRYVRVRIGDSIFKGECVVSVNFTSSSQQRLPGRPPRLLLVKIEQLRLSHGDWFYSKMSNPFRRTSSYCYTSQCGATYLWATESVDLYLYLSVPSSLRPNVSYDASFVLSEATNMCDFASRSGELLVQSGGSSEYLFAPDLGHKELPPNNVTCSSHLEYSVSVRPSVASALLTVAVLACPSNDSCWTLLLNGRGCRDGETLVLLQPVSNFTLQYVPQNGCEDNGKFSGFIVSARTDPSTESLTLTVIIAASVAALVAAALAVGVTSVLLCRRRRRRSLGRKPVSGTVHNTPSAVSTSYEQITMVDNELYGVTLASSAVADQ